MRRRVVTLWSVLCLNLLASAKAPPDGAPRVALVIGNSSYAGLWPELHTEPLRDAELMRDTLSSLGFQVVYRHDADLAQMKGALREFRATLRKSPGALAVVYYAGHGTQAFVTNSRGTHIENYLVPARTDLDTEADVREKTIALDRVESLMRAAGASAGVVLLDASRDNGLQHGPEGDVPLHGLAPHKSAEQIVMYATRPGRFSYRTRTDMPSVFTLALAKELSGPGTISAALQRVRDRVREATQDEPYGAQLPALQDHLGQEFAMVSPSDTPPPMLAVPAETFRDCVMCPEMVRVPPGSFVMGSSEDEDKRVSTEGPAHEVHLSYTLAVSKYPITRGQWRQYLMESGHRGSRDCYGFNNSVWKRAKTPEYGWDDPGYRQEDSHPVVCVSWNEVQEYATWISKKTGHHYRLMSETELEYVERAGNRNAFPWGPTSASQCEHVNAADATGKARFPNWTEAATCFDGFLFTSPVDRFPGNVFGLYDTDGNVRSWAQDCYHDSYRGAPTDGSAWESGGDCSQRIIRGAAWDTPPPGLRSAARHWDLVDSNNDTTGVRLARTDVAPLAPPEPR